MSIRTRTIRAARTLLALGIVSAVAAFTVAPAGAAPADGVDVGVATSFAVLGASTVTNTGPTVVNGDLGVSPGPAVTGFGPGIVNGSIYAANDLALSAQAAAGVAYDDIAGRSADVTVSANLGGQTLTDGVYTGGALEVTGPVPLTLDAEGNPDALFIFQAASSLLIGNSSSVALINGASPCNVYWQVTSDVTIETDSVFTGTVIALNSIWVRTGAIVEGRLLARNGEVTLDTNVITAPDCDVEDGEDNTPPSDDEDTTGDDDDTIVTPPVAPEAPVAPETPVVPDTPVVPVTPDTPVVPAAPDTPVVPVTPETPAVPVTPETPAVPVTPETPALPNLPETGAAETTRLMTIGVMSLLLGCALTLTSRRHTA